MTTNRHSMEEHRTTAGQGLGIAGLVLGILAIPMGIIPCTFYIGIVFGIIGIVLSLVALSQANRGNGPRGLIIAALACSIVGLIFASAVGFTITRDGAKFVKEIIREKVDHEEEWNDTRDAAGEMLRDLESDTAAWEEDSDKGLQQMTDTLKALESE